MIIGGGMTLLCKALGGKIGNSICEDDKQELEILRLAKKRKGVQIHIQLM
jgi:phosphoglycerate kinase